MTSPIQMTSSGTLYEETARLRRWSAASTLLGLAPDHTQEGSEIHALPGPGTVGKSGVEWSGDREKNSIFLN